MTIRDQLNLLQKKTDAVQEQVMDKRDMVPSVKRDWDNFYQKVRAFTSIDDAAIESVSTVDAQKEIVGMTAELDSWKGIIENVIRFDVGLPSSQQMKTGGTIALVGIGVLVAGAFLLMRKN